MNESTTTPASAAPAPRQDPPKWFQVLVGIGMVAVALWGIGACADAMSEPGDSAPTARSDFPSASALQAEFAAPPAAVPPSPMQGCEHLYGTPFLDCMQAKIDRAEAAAVPPAAPQPPAGPATSFGNGTHVVGEDIAPGTYKATPSGTCYWARLSSTSDEGDIIANHLADGPTTVTIKKGDAAFVSSRCGTWEKR